MVTRDDIGGFVVHRVITGDAAVDGFLEDGDLIFIRAWDSGFEASGVDAHGCVLDIVISM
jgi:hypothetical protein